MSRKVGTVLIDVAADTSKLVQGMNNANRTVTKTVGDIKKTLFTMAAAYASVSTAFKVKDMITDTLDLADETGKLAKKLGLTTEALSKYQYVADFAGVSQGELNAGISAMIRRLNNFQRDGGGAAAKAMETLGISAEYARENFVSTDDAFVEILKRIEKMPDGYRKTAVAQDIFSKSASNLVNLTASDLEELGKQAEMTGNVISTSAAQMAAEYNDSIDAVSARIGGLTKEVSLALLPAMNATTEAMLDMMNQTSDGQQDFNDLTFAAADMIESMAGGIGFIKDSWTGVKIVVKSIEELFYFTGWAINAFFDNTVLSIINESIDKYNMLADLIGTDKISNIVNTTTKENADRVNQLSSEIKELSTHLTDGRTAADAWSKDFREKLEKNIKASKEASKIIMVDPGRTDVKGATHTINLGLDENTKNVIKQYEAALGLITPELDKINTQYGDMYDVVKDIFTTEQLEAFYTVWGEKIDAIAAKNSGLSDQLKSDLASYGVTSKDWTAGLEGTAKEIANIGNSFADIGEDMRKYQKLQNDIASSTASEADKKAAMAALDAKHTESQLAGYANMAGAMSNFFDEGTKQAHAFQAVQEALMIVNGINAILTQGMGDPYTAFARMAAMAASVAALGVSVKGMQTPSVSGDAFAMQAANTGTGTVLGDADAQSRSIANSLEYLESVAKPELGLISQMAASLRSIDQKMGGVAAQIVKVGSFALGSGFTASSEGSTIDNLYDPTTDVTNFFSDKFGGDSWVTDVADYFGDAFKVGIGSTLAETVIGGIVGGSTETTLSDSGLKIDTATLADAINNLSGATYQVSKTVEDGGWFHSDDTSYSTSYGTLSNSITDQFSSILSSMYDTIILSSDALGISTNDTAAKLDAFNVAIGKISLNGKTGEQIEEELSAVFGAIFDNMAYTAFDDLKDFQVVGEGYGETLARVAGGYSEATYYADKLGLSIVEFADIVNKQGDVAYEALSQTIIEASTKNFGDIFSYLGEMGAEELTTLYNTLNEVRSTLSILSGSFIDMSAVMISGAGGIDELKSGADAYLENYFTDAEQTAVKTDLLTEEFEKLGLELPGSRDAFKDLINSFDLTTDAGQLLYGSVLTLSEDFANISDSVSESLSQLDSLYLGQYSPLSMLQKTAYANNVAYSAIDSGSTNAIDAAYTALQTAAASATRDEDITVSFNNYASLLENQVDDSTRTDIVNAIKTMTLKIEDLEDELARTRNEGVA